MKFLAILTNKVVSKTAALFNRGSSLPGYLTRKIDKNILSKLDLGENIVIVTGTNGKTSTTKYIADVLEKSGHSVVTNASGANMPQGITTEIVKNVNLKGQLNSDYLILEVDEAYVKEINNHIKADYLLVNNLFKDQVDRFPEINMVKDIIIKGIVKENKLVLNADDPYTKHIGDLCANDKIYFGFKGDVIKSDDYNEETTCPNCNEILSYNSLVYSHLGDYSCSCGFEYPKEVHDVLSQYNKEDETVTINDDVYKLNNVALYNTYNYLAAVSVLKELNISTKNISNALSNAVVGLGRMEVFDHHGQQCFVNLVKNPTGLNETLNYIKQLDQKHTLFLAVHSRVPDGPNIDWLNEINLDQSNVEEFIITGDEAKRVGELLTSQGIKVTIIDDLDEAVSYTLNKTDQPSYLLANYTALPFVRNKVFK